MSHTECRRCYECVGSEHHWIEELTYALLTGEGEPLGDPIGDRVCKHCEAIGNECDDCDGVGAFDEDEEDPEVCPSCHGAGVVVRKRGPA